MVAAALAAAPVQMDITSTASMVWPHNAGLVVVVLVQKARMLECQTVAAAWSAAAALAAVVAAMNAPVEAAAAVASMLTFFRASAVAVATAFHQVADLHLLAVAGADTVTAATQATTVTALT